MIENAHAAARASRLLLAALALPVSPWAAAQSAASASEPGHLNLQLPARTASAASIATGNALKPRGDATPEAPAQTSPGTTQNAPRFNFAGAEEPRSASINAADRALKAHKEMFDRQPDCPTPFDSGAMTRSAAPFAATGPVTAEPRERLPNCRTWRKPANAR